MLSPAEQETVARFRASTQASHRRGVERAVRRMRRRLSENLTLDEMADAAAMSPFHFNRVFHRLTGLPPGQFLGALRIEEAKRLLLSTDRSVTDICFEVGYNSLGTFTTRFTHLVGVSPAKFRRLARRAPVHRLRELLRRPPAARSSEKATVHGRVASPRCETGVIFLGLFDAPMPCRRPVACAILPAPGEFRLVPPGDGRYHLFAAANADCRDAALPAPGEEMVVAVGGAGPLEVCGGRVSGPTELSLHPLEPLDPPLLAPLTLLVAERLAGRAGAGAAA